MSENGNVGGWLRNLWLGGRQPTFAAAFICLTLMLYRDFTSMMREHNANVEASMKEGLRQQAEETRAVGVKLDAVTAELRQIRGLTRKD